MNRLRTERIHLIHWLLCLYPLLLPAAGVTGEPLQGEIRFAPARDGATWVGQQRELNLELWSNGFSFSDQLFVLPEVKGGYLVQADSSTVKLTETRGDVQWQGLRYTLLLYPQRAGRLEVPSFDVQFSARAAYNSDPAPFGYRTPALRVEARLPPGVDGRNLLVTTGSFSMEWSWTPRIPDQGPAGLKVGDSLTLQITRQAHDVPGMVFPPLPAFSIDGLATYPATPRVNDRVDRGALTGFRTDLITFICEKEGRYTIPGLSFQWWDPGREVLSQEVIPELELVISANPAFSTGPGGPAQPDGALDWKSLAAAVVLVLFFSYLAWRAWPLRAPGWLMRRGEWLLEKSGMVYRTALKPANPLPPLNP